MIKSVSGDKYISVASNTRPYINGIDAGQLRFSTTTQRLQVHNGHTWIDIESEAHVSLSMDAHRAIEWAHKKMLREQEYTELAQKHVTVQDALDSLVRAQERLDLVVALTRNEGNHA